jgi:hypothetical protein
VAVQEARFVEGGNQKEDYPISSLEVEMHIIA